MLMLRACALGWLDRYTYRTGFTLHNHFLFWRFLVCSSFLIYPWLSLLFFFFELSLIYLSLFRSLWSYLLRSFMSTLSQADGHSSVI
jgi:hypothetical protein